MEETRAALDALDATLAGAAQPPDAQALAAHHTARIRRIFGKDFPVLPRFTIGNAAEVAASLAEQGALCAADALAPLEWLQRMALVRPDVDALQRVITATALLDGAVEPADLRVAQLPHVSGQRWLGLPQDDAAIVDADVAFVFHALGAPAPAAALAGIVCDEWVETIPAAVETTGLAFHYDAPGARAPNAVLLAVPGAVDASTWTFDELLDVVREASQLMKVRMIGPRQIDALGVLLPATYLPENFRRDVPSIDMGKLTAVKATGPIVMGKVLT
jgi:hypothetical protein